jgi:hypothetical protein
MYESGHDLMPIKAENKKLYPRYWKEISYYIRFIRANGFCELCGAEHGRPHPITKSKVVLTTMHLDHDPTNCDPENLKAGCQKCHLSYDAKHHAKNAKETRENKKANLEPRLIT